MNSGATEEVFTDTSALFNYTFEDDDGSARHLILQHPCTQCTSENVKSEFERVRDNRQHICNEFITYAASGNIEDFEPSNADELSENDWEFVENLRETLSDLDPTMAVKRVNRRLRQLKSGWNDLFGDSNPYVRVVTFERVGPGLAGNLNSTVENQADCLIITDAADWCYNGGSGVFITSDKDDTLGRADEERKRPLNNNDSHGLPETFAGLVQGDDRSLPEQINEKIRNSPDYGDSCCLEFYSPQEYV